jgi:hypothetical protein
MLQLRCLFTWLAYTRGSFTLAAMKKLLELVKDWQPSEATEEGTTGKKKLRNGLDIEMELDGSLSLYVKSLNQRCTDLTSRFVDLFLFPRIITGPKHQS